MAVQPYVPQNTSPSIVGAPAYAPPRRLLFASNISDSVGARTLSRAEIDQAIRENGTNIAVMVDVGGKLEPSGEAKSMLRYLRERGVKQIGIYTEGRTGPTGNSYEGGEFARKEAAKRKYGMTEQQWMNGGWEKSFHDHVRHYSKNYGATFFEADNIPQGQTIKYLKQFQAAKDRGELPPHVQMLLKNPVDSEIKELRSALANGSVKRQSIADFAISEERYRSSWPSLRKGLAEFGIQLGCSHKTQEYACKEKYDPSLLGALGRFVKDIAHGAAAIIGGVVKGVASVFGIKSDEDKPAHRPNYDIRTTYHAQTAGAHGQRVTAIHQTPRSKGAEEWRVYTPASAPKEKEPNWRVYAPASPQTKSTPQ